MEIHFIGMDVKQSRDFLCDRPNGSGDYDLLFVHTGAFLMLDGVRYETGGDTLIIFSPRCRQYYGAINGNYTEDFMHFDFESDAYLLQKYAIPLDKPIKISNAHKIVSVIREIQKIKLENSKMSHEEIDLYMQILFLLISENLTEIPEDTGVNSDFLNIRVNAYNNPCRIKSIPELAYGLGISVSCFHRKYKEIFGIPPTDDFIKAKLERACFLLKSTEKPIKQISEESGYSCNEHFMRQFKSRIGITPSEYRTSSRG